MPKPRPLSRLSITVCVIWFLFCAIAFSDAGFNLFGFYFAVLFGLVWMLVWLARLSSHGFRQYKNRPTAVQHPKLYWTMEPLVMILAVALAGSGVFSYARFFASLPALNQYAGQVRAGQVDLAFEFKHPPRHVGLYTVAMTDLLPDGTVRIITSSHSLLDEAGFANSPSNPPPVRGEDSYKHIHGAWWYWYQSW